MPPRRGRAAAAAAAATDSAAANLFDETHNNENEGAAPLASSKQAAAARERRQPLIQSLSLSRVPFAGALAYPFRRVTALAHRIRAWIEQKPPSCSAKSEGRK